MDRDELVDRLIYLKDRFDLDIYLYEKWEGSSDFIRYVTSKLKLLERKDELFYLTELGYEFQSILHHNEEQFRDKLFILSYRTAFSLASRYWDFCNFIILNAKKEGFITYNLFTDAKRNIMVDNQFTNKYVISFLEDLEVIKSISQKENRVHLNINRLSIINPEVTALSILKNSLTMSKQIPYDEAKDLLSNFNIDPNLIDILEMKGKLVIRITRTGKYLDFN